MKRLTLLRHAKSSWDQHGLADHERPLAQRGLRDAPRMGRRLAELGVAPDLVLTSSATRALQTGELITAQLGRDSLETRIEPRIYLASPGELLEVIAAQDAAVEELMLVGHNPGLTTLVNMLLPGLRLANLPTAGAVAIDCDIDAWSAIDSAGFSLRCYEFPKKLRTS